MDEFVIKIGDELKETPIPQDPPPLKKGHYKAWGQPSRDRVQVLLTQNAYKQINEHATSDLNTEVGGVLLGKATLFEGTYYVLVETVMPASLTQAGAAHLTFTADSWSAILNEKDRNPDLAPLMVVGWYHTHPRMSIFLSGDDQFVHKNFFPERWHIALVLEPTKHHGGFFVRRDGEIESAHGFYEIFDKEKKSIINWKNLFAEPAPKPATPSATNQIAWGVAAFMTIAFACIAFLMIFFLWRNYDRAQDELSVARQTAEAAQSQAIRLSEQNTRTFQTLVAQGTPISTLHAIQTAEARATAIQVAGATATAVSVQQTQTAQFAQATAVAQTATLSAQKTQAAAQAISAQQTAAAQAVQTSFPITSVQGLEIRNLVVVVKDKPLPQNPTISVGEEITFSLTIANNSQTEVVVTNLRIDFQNQGEPITVFQELRLKPGESRGFSPKKPFTQPGNYIAYIVADQNGKPLKILPKQDVPYPLSFTVR